MSECNVSSAQHTVLSDAFFVVVPEALHHSRYSGHRGTDQTSNFQCSPPRLYLRLPLGVLLAGGHWCPAYLCLSPVLLAACPACRALETGYPTPVPVHLSTSSSAARECTPTASPAERPASLHHLHHHHNCHFLTRLVLLRGMGVLYTAAFLTSAFQSRALFGTSGHLVHHACCLLSSLHHIG